MEVLLALVPSLVISTLVIAAFVVSAIVELAIAELAFAEFALVELAFVKLALVKVGLVVRRGRWPAVLLQRVGRLRPGATTVVADDATDGANDLAVFGDRMS